MKDKVEFSFIKKYPSLMEGIFDLINISKSQLKKYQINKKFLQREVRTSDEISLPISLINQKMINPCYEGANIDIIFEDEKVLALNKPPKIHTHPLSYVEMDNALSWLRSNCHAALLKVNDSEYDRGLLYRLDYETSGLLIYIKNDIDLKNLRQNFHDMVFGKEYYALVEGKIPNKKLVNFLSTSGKKVRVDEKGKKAEIEVRRLEYDEVLDRSKVSIKLKQGLRHQIRVQLAQVGFPIIGDHLYGGAESNRLELYCYQYDFKINNKMYSIKINE